MGGSEWDAVNGVQLKKNAENGLLPRGQAREYREWNVVNGNMVLEKERST